MSYIVLVLTGALLCNAIPHLTSGLCGDPFPTPFAKPRGVGNSSPTINFVWGFANLAAGVVIAAVCRAAAETPSGLIAMAVGFFALGAMMSRHFGSVRRGR